MGFVAVAVALVMTPAAVHRHYGGRMTARRRLGATAESAARGL
jgi:hypothetical protein